MESLWQDFRYGVRMLLKNRSVTLVAMVTLALGIGANTAIFSVVDAVLLRSVPYPQADRLVILWSTMQAQDIPRSGSALPDYREWRDQNHVFEGLGGFYYGDFNLSGQNQDPERVQGAFVTPSLFSVLDVAPVIGRGFLPEEDQFGRHRVVLLSYALWQRRYAGDQEIIGHTINLGGEAYTVVGVMPRGMPFLDNTPQVELWRPISFPPGDNMDSRNNHFVTLIGRLKKGVSIDEAQADVSAIARNIRDAFPGNDALDGLVASLREQLVGDVRSGLVAIINETVARRFFPNEDPIGKTIWMGPPESLIPPGPRTPGARVPRRIIVGVVADIKGPNLDKQANPEVFAPYYQNKNEGWMNTLMLAVRTTIPPQNVIGSVRDVVRDLDREQPVASVATMEERLSRALSEPRFSTMLLGLFAAIALLLAAVGIFGVMSYAVTQRTHEIGIRMALGARRRDVLALVLGHGMRLTVVGLAIGLAASFALTRLMATLLFGVGATDPATFAAISVVLAVVVLLACYLPARRATKVDPMVALRYE